jgi:antitoxin (DNA-binding transcriptional repressor) of toxin-antitoxin stability system
MVLASDELITKHGKPIARLMPVNEPDHLMIGRFKGKILINGDVMSTGEPGDAEP